MSRSLPVSSVKKSDEVPAGAKQILLGKKGEDVALIDGRDFEWLSQERWHLNHQGYVLRVAKMPDGRRQNILMHRAILEHHGVDLDGWLVDHANGRRNDNRYQTEPNIRRCTRGQNRMNSRLNVDNTSGYKGVTEFKDKWQATIHVNFKQHSLGCWDLREEAAVAVELAGRHYYKDFFKGSLPELDPDESAVAEAWAAVESAESRGIPQAFARCFYSLVVLLAATIHKSPKTVPKGWPKGVIGRGDPIKYQARFCCNKAFLHLGTFDSQLDAALAYDAASVAEFGRWAYQNYLPTRSVLAKPTTTCQLAPADTEKDSSTVSVPGISA